jgi:UDP-3-O-[3-hydroxymyristoyl] N-acetylglucosamine deacetylase
MILQRTIKKPVETIGIGLHSGCRVIMRLLPAPDNYGIVFRRVDLEDHVEIKCDPLNINDTTLSSTLIVNNIKIATIEHLMSALACYGIDNLLIEISDEEIPIMDGSSNSFLYLLDQAEVVEQTQKKKYIKVLQPIKIELEDKWVELQPFDGYKIKLTINFGDHPLFQPPNNSLEIDFSNKSYLQEISRARTFGFMYEIEYLLKNGLGLGGNLNNAVLISEDNVINQNGLRFPNEFIRHKILDAIGDLYIAGHPIIGAFVGYKSGHALNNMLLRKLLSCQDSWEYVTFDQEGLVPKGFHHYVSSLRA